MPKNAHVTVADVEKGQTAPTLVIGGVDTAPNGQSKARQVTSNNSRNIVLGGYTKSLIDAFYMSVITSAALTTPLAGKMYMYLFSCVPLFCRL